MPIARYPRPGKRIAPRSLARFFAKPLPPEVAVGAAAPAALLLRDLDGSVWASLGDTAVRRAADAVVEEVRRNLPAIRELRITNIPEHLQWLDLHLGARAYNALAWRRDHARLAALGGQTLGDL